MKSELLQQSAGENPREELPLEVEEVVVLGDEEEMIPVRLDCLYTERLSPCDLFHRRRNGGYIFYAAQGTPFEKRIKDRLLAYGVEYLYIHSGDIPLYFNYVREALTSLVRDPFTPSRKKAEAVHSTCKDIMRRVFDDPRASFINQAHEVITPTVDLIVSDDHAARCLIRLTAYDHSTYVHSTNVGIFGIALARILFHSSSGHDMDRLGAGFFLHDLGKCRTPLEILNKPGPLTGEERGVINRHPEEGCSLLEAGGFLTDEARILTLQHHERDDRQGYPYGLGREDIHPYARICRLADVYEALTSLRPYHQPRSTFQALKFMQERIVSDMDQDLLRHFIRLFRG